MSGVILLERFKPAHYYFLKASAQQTTDCGNEQENGHMLMPQLTPVSCEPSCSGLGTSPTLQVRFSLLAPIR